MWPCCGLDISSSGFSACSSLPRTGDFMMMRLMVTCHATSRLPFVFPVFWLDCSYEDLEADCVLAAPQLSLVLESPSSEIHVWSLAMSSSDKCSEEVCACDAPQVSCTLNIRSEKRSFCLGSSSTAELCKVFKRCLRESPVTKEGSSICSKSRQSVLAAATDFLLNLCRMRLRDRSGGGGRYLYPRGGVRMVDECRGRFRS